MRLKLLALLTFLVLAPNLYSQQINLPTTGGGSVSTLTAGTNSNVGNFHWSQAGVFTNAQMNQTALWTLTGGGSCSPLALANGGGSTSKLTDDIAGCVNIPSSGVTNAFTNVFGAYCGNANGLTTGQFGWVGCVGYYDAIQCSGSGGAHCWGANFSVTDATATGGVNLIGNEYDVSVNQNGTTGYGQLMSFRQNGQPTADTFPGIVIQTPAGTGAFTSGYECQDGSTSTTVCIRAGQVATGNGSNSQFIGFYARNSAGTQVIGSLQMNQDNIFALGHPHTAVVNPAGEESYSIDLTATAALAIGTLVKIDTAHADSVVVCTTADTSCDGFVQGTNGTNGLCTVGSTTCPINTVPGSKTKGIIGTGTCSIGNFVIVDTTTNGDIQCTGTPPTIGKVIGKALSACAATCAGTLLDILTKFE